ncbi:MAG TPA: asparagine synthase (glutamine-hydrolyzing) [Candidatus Sulfotelmatobacter sp.]|nr:asparagine synthase (glutamine-hydrolyzing) [Candidatus Sulfotelmatobacter sp.]
MCGICGIYHFGTGQLANDAALRKMNHQIWHRGPDDAGTMVSLGVGLAMRRLSIIDLSTGHQPISNEDETIWIVFNGEIYNYVELRTKLIAQGHSFRTHSDTETIVHLYEQYGHDCVQHLRGMFAFVIWDKLHRKLFAARDRLGIKPFYYSLRDGTFLFGSEIKAVLAYSDVRPEFNARVLPEYLAFGYISGEDTLFSGIRKLPAGHTLELGESGELAIRRYWDLSVSEDSETRPRTYYVQHYREFLEDAVSSHLMSDVPLGVFLSGGLDSSAVAALTARSRQEPIQTFAVGYAEQEYSELSYARVVADHIGSDHHEVQITQDRFFDSLPDVIWHEDEPVSWPSSVALHHLAKLASEHVTVVLTGEGSDETLAGYTRYAWTVWNARMDAAYRAITPSALRAAVREQIRSAKLNATIRRRLEHTCLGRDGASWSSFYFDNFLVAFSAAEQEHLLTLEMQKHLHATYRDSLSFWDRSSGTLLKRLLYTDINTYLVELLMKQDQMSMSASIESRVPFLDHPLVEFAARIPSRYALKGLEGKCILKSAVEDLLPHSIIYRKKMGFPTPWSGWLAGARLNKLENLLVQDRTLARGLFRREAIQKLFKDHRSGSHDNSNRIWRLLNLELWFRLFVDRDSSLLTKGGGALSAADSSAYSAQL